MDSNLAHSTHAYELLVVAAQKYESEYFWQRQMGSIKE